jgi:hypothetical protein
LRSFFPCRGANGANASLLACFAAAADLFQKSNLQCTTKKFNFSMVEKHNYLSSLDWDQRDQVKQQTTNTQTIKQHTY